MCGKEFCNAYTELNDPFEQRLRFEEQVCRYLGVPRHTELTHFRPGRKKLVMTKLKESTKHSLMRELVAVILP